MLKSKFYLVALVLAFVNEAAAMLAPVTVQPGRVSPPISGGAITGGIAGEEFTLLKVVKENSPGTRSAAEKWTFTYGDRLGRPIHKEPGFFHINIDRDSKRIVIDLAQVSKTTLETGAMDRLARSSHLVASSEMITDPQDKSMNITFNMRSAVEVRVSSETSSDGNFIVIFSPILPAKNRSSGSIQ